MQPMDHFRKISRRSLIRVISYSLSAIVALAGLGVYGYTLATRYRTQLEYTYERALVELSNHLNSIDTSLQKGLYAGTATQVSELSISLWSEAGAAKTCLGQLPTNKLSLDNTNKFLSQVGEYSRALSRKVISGEKISEDEREQLVSLAEFAKDTSTRVSAMRDEMNEGRLWINEVRNIIEKSASGSKTTDTLYTSLSDIEESFTDYPTLLYDGPYSDHILQSKPVFLKEKKEVTVETAAQTAAKMTGLSRSELEHSPDADEDGAMPAYIFSTDSTTSAISKAGGYCIYFLNPRTVGDTKISYEDAVSKAQEYLKGVGLGTFKESYYMTNEGVCVINFAYVQDGTVCYTDLIKVGVALDNGEIVSYNARGFIMNHHDRKLQKPPSTVGQAQAVLSPVLKVNSNNLAIIPSDSREEKHCYEFVCTGADGKSVLVYVNVKTLQEEDILILLQTDGGTLTI